MNSIRRWFLTAANSLALWPSNGGVMAVFALGVTFGITLSTLNLEGIRHYGLSVGALEPYLLMTNDWSYAFFLHLGMLLLLCDAPFFTGNEAFCLSRVGRGDWFVGKLVYMAVALLLFQAVVFVTLLAGHAGRMTFAPGWSQFLGAAIRGLTVEQMIATDYISKLSWSTLAPLTPVMTPALACLHSLALTWLYGMVQALILFVCNLAFKRVVGILVAILPKVVDLLVWGGAERLAMFSLPTHARLVAHSFGGATMGLPRLWQSYVVLGAVLVVLAYAVGSALERHSFKTGE